MRTTPLWVMLFALITTISTALAAADTRPTVYVVNYPLQYLTARIAGDSAQVVFPAPPDEDPAFWKPDVKTIAAFQVADLIVINGATYAKWLQNASLPKAKTVDTSAAFKAQYIATQDTVTHSHGPSGEHAHTGTAFTTWLNFHLAAQQAKAITTALSRLLPAQQTAFESRYTTLENDLMALDARLDALVSSKRAQPLLASHPVYQYFAKRFDLNLQSVLWEPDSLPHEAQWQALQALLAKHPAKWMLWEGEPLAATVDKLQALGIKSLVFDPCGNTPERGDFLSVMQQNIVNLQQAFQ